MRSPPPGAQIHARGKPLEADVDLEQVARDLPGLSGAELANVLNEAALEAVRRAALSISSADVYNAIDRILQVISGFRAQAQGLGPCRVIQRHRLHSVGECHVLVQCWGLWLGAGA